MALAKARIPSTVEEHPYLTPLNCAKKYKYLIIGTFPPNREVREDQKSFVDYFYGNTGSFWNIVDTLYPAYKLKSSAKQNRKNIIQQWQDDYSIAISDVLARTARKNIGSSSDSDLVFTHQDLNHGLRDYVLESIELIEQVYFTSSEGDHSAFRLFHRIMGDDGMAHIPAQKVKAGLVSPSNAVNTSLFNKPSLETLGLEDGLYAYIVEQRPDLLPFYRERWKVKQNNRRVKMQGFSKTELSKSEKGIVIAYKTWAYKKVLPTPLQQ